MDLGKYAGEGSKFERNPFLSAKDVGKGATIKVLTVREAPREMKFSDLLMDLTIGAKKYTWGLKFEGMALNQLIGRLGKETDRWKNKTVKLTTLDWFNKRTKKKMKIINVA